MKNMNSSVLFLTSFEKFFFSVFFCFMVSNFFIYFYLFSFIFNFFLGQLNSPGPGLSVGSAGVKVLADPFGDDKGCTAIGQSRIQCV